MKKNSIILVVLLFCSSLFAQNKYPFGIFNYSTVNPAAVGIKKSSIGVYYGTPFSGIADAPKYQFLNIQKSLNDQTGLGVLFDSYTAGPSSILNINFSYSHVLKLNETLNLSLGLSAGFKMFTLDENQFIVNDPTDNAISGNLRKERFSNANTGLVLFREQWHWGLSVNNLINSELFSTVANQSEINRPSIISFFDYKLKINDFELHPSTLINVDLSHLTYLMDVNLMTDYRGVQLGTSFRNFKRITLISGIKRNNLHLNYAYSFPSNDVSNMLGGGHHVIINFYF